MTQIVVIGNSGSGKSTLARELEQRFKVPRLELDDLVWKPGEIGVVRPIDAVMADLDRFLASHREWVVEGCYGELAKHCLGPSSELIWLNPSVEVCVQNTLKRPWEPHKYASKEDQDAQLENLLAWVRSYPTREDDWSEKAHRQVFDGFSGRKRELRSSSEFWNLSS